MIETKKLLIENELAKKGYVTNRWCWDNYITPRLGRYIEVLRKEGVMIGTYEPELGGFDTRYYQLNTDGEPLRKVPKCYKLTYKK